MLEVTLFTQKHVDRQPEKAEQETGKKNCRSQVCADQSSSPKPSSEREPKLRVCAVDSGHITPTTEQGASLACYCFSPSLGDSLLILENNM